ncbi:PQQ-binding-like beta-propeller repeat protein [Armatimonas sp.]|uniref:PQQ-binding-like beta-propeller repeat protein n=1 Tax=Armatimonas sp. TaxID=1872638 RepID=UPI00286B3E00|nr:PQQ-binding-like beta-propeller repeat protein [Armatimonas sp.]
MRQWTQLLGDGVSVIAGEKGTLYYQSRQEVGAIDLATGTKKWSSLAGQRIDSICFRAGILYALVAGNALYAINANTGSARLLQHFPQGIRRLTQDPDQLYALDERGALHALSPRTGQTLWSTVLVSSPKPDTVSVVLAATCDGIYVGIDEKNKVGEELGIAPESGRVLWRRKVSFPEFYSHTVIEGDVIFYGEKPRRINALTGNVVWTARGYLAQGPVLGNAWLTSGWDTTQGYDLTTGKRLWKSPVPYGDILSSCSDGQNLLIEAMNYSPTVQGTYCLSREGKLRWQADKPFTGSPFYADQNNIVTFDQIENRFLGYVPGALPRLPATAAGKKALAERQVAQFETLDAAERQQLEKLKPYSARAFLPRYLELAKHRIQNLDTYLLAFCEKENTAALLELWKQGGGEAAERALQAKGNPDIYIPVFLQKLLTYPQKLRSEGMQSEYLLSVIEHSSYPDAVAFMRNALSDPQAPREWRTEAFRHLAGTGGAEGIAAVRAARTKPNPRKPWFECIALDKHDKEDVVAMKKDTKGRTWMLFHSAILGNGSDLFIVEKKQEGWSTPLFTGAWTAGRGFLNADAPTAFRGIPIEKLEKSEWIKIFPDDPILRKDTDSDGLTNLVEVRLGTDPKKADTDCDGLPDAIDPCPNAAPRSLGDTEQILSACMEAWLFGQQSQGAMVIFNPEVAPFEFHSWLGQLLWRRGKKQDSWKSLADSGADAVSFYHPIRSHLPKKELVEFSADHQSARIVLHVIPNGCVDTESRIYFLKKIDGEWFVVDWIKLLLDWWSS